MSMHCAIILLAHWTYLKNSYRVGFEKAIEYLTKPHEPPIFTRGWANERKITNLT